VCVLCFFFSSRRRHTRLVSDWSSDVCSSDLYRVTAAGGGLGGPVTSVVTVGNLNVRLNFTTADALTQKDNAWVTLLYHDVLGRRSEERRVGKECRTRGWAGQ